MLSVVSVAERLLCNALESYTEFIARKRRSLLIR